MKKAIVFGASGNIGGYLIEELSNDNNYDQVLVVARKNLSIKSKKIKLILGDYHTLNLLEDKMIADDVFIIIGSSDWDVDRNYPIAIAKILKANGALNIFVVTAVGANSNSFLKFTRRKGEIEDAIKNLNFKYTCFFRPAMILGKRDYYRPMEKFMMFLWQCIDPLFMGKFNKYKGMHARDIACAMHLSGSSDVNKVSIYHWQEMYNLNKNKLNT